MQYWDDILYPNFISTIRGQYYGVISRDSLDEECYNYAVRAVAAFKFPRIDTSFTTFYAIREKDANGVENNILNEVDPAFYPDAVPHAYFNNDLTAAEIEVIIAWMKVYWCETQLSNADNFEDLYTDANIKTFSRANAVDKNTNLMKMYRENARDLENRYSRIYVDTVTETSVDGNGLTTVKTTKSRTPSIGRINEEEE